MNFKFCILRCFSETLHLRHLVFEGDRRYICIYLLYYLSFNIQRLFIDKRSIYFPNLYVSQNTTCYQDSSVKKNSEKATELEIELNPIQKNPPRKKKEKGKREEKTDKNSFFAKLITVRFERAYTNCAEDVSTRISR